MNLPAWPRSSTGRTCTLSHRYFHSSKFGYLENVARLKQYASDRETPKPALLQTSKKGFLNLFGADGDWRTRARTDLADTLDRMPTFRCECGTMLRAGAEMVGEKCVCSRCRRTVRVPFDAPGSTNGGPPGTGRMTGMFTAFLIAATAFLASGFVLAAFLANASWTAVGAAAALVPVACTLRPLYAYNRAFRGHSKESAAASDGLFIRTPTTPAG